MGAPGGVVSQELGSEYVVSVAKTAGDGNLVFRESRFFVKKGRERTALGSI